LAEEKYNLIREMKTLYPIDEFLKASIKHYKTLASIYKVFENSTSRESKFDISELYQAKNCIVETIVDKPRKTITESDDLLKVYQQQTEDIRLLSYKLLLEGMNKKYSILDEDQKIILREYINNVSNTNSLGNFISDRIDDVKVKLSEISVTILDADAMKIKICEVVKQLDKVRPTNGVVKDNQIMSLLLSYELLKEIKKQIKMEEAPND
jgi:hypothetical protein